MIRGLLVLVLCLGISSCAYSSFPGIYNTALKAGTTLSFTKAENYQELKERIHGYFESQGYKTIVFQNDKKGFFVFSKEGDFNEPCRIILKYSLKAGINEIHINMVKGSDDLVTDSEVSDDMQAIAERIKNG